MIISGLNSKDDLLGVRYYDSDLSVWLSVDPMSDKYPNQSAYSYVGWRPINVIDPNGLWDQDASGNWVAAEGDSWWSFHEKTGMSWKETMAYAKKYNADKGRDNWKSVREGDQVTLPGSEKKGEAATSEANSATQGKELVDKYNIATIENKTNPQNSSSGPGSAWDPLIQALNDFGNKGDIFPLLSILTDGGPGGMICPAPLASVGATARSSKWIFGAFKTEAKWMSQFLKRGWTKELVTEAVTNGKSY